MGSTGSKAPQKRSIENSYQGTYGVIVWDESKGPGVAFFLGGVLLDKWRFSWDSWRFSWDFILAILEPSTCRIGGVISKNCQQLVRWQSSIWVNLMFLHQASKLENKKTIFFPLPTFKFGSSCHARHSLKKMVSFMSTCWWKNHSDFHLPKLGENRHCEHRGRQNR